MNKIRKNKNKKEKNINATGNMKSSPVHCAEYFK